MGRSDRRLQRSNGSNGVSDNPFVRYRTRLDSYAKAMEAGWSDDDFVALVERLDDAVAEVDARLRPGGHGFRVTPLIGAASLTKVLELDVAGLWVKDDTDNVSGSHKARHLFGVALHLAVDGTEDGELAIASCGNAALGAAVIARAIERPLRVFIPAWADAAVVERLESLDAMITVCPRRPGEVGDPTYLRFLEAVAEGSIPFSVQSTATATTLDGGRTLGWELADQLEVAEVSGRTHLFVQIGGGALATATWRGLIEGAAENDADFVPVLHAVQTVACAPLPRAWDHLTELVHTGPAPVRARALLKDDGFELVAAAMEVEPDSYMWPWEAVGTSDASGILDDVTYDWEEVVLGMVASAGWPIVVSEDQVREANRDARYTTGIDVDATGTSGLAGTLDLNTRAAIEPDDHVVVLFTGALRH